MSQPNILLSIVIPTYNGEKYLGDTLQSIHSQIDDAVEVIILDDGSSDSTVDIINSFEFKNKVILNTNLNLKNWVLSTNHGINISNGTYLCFLHQDDMWEAGRYNEIKCAIKDYPNFSVLLNPSNFINAKGEIVGNWSLPFKKYKKINTIDRHILLNYLIVQNFIAIPAPVFRKELALEVGLLNPELWYTADWEFWLKLISSGKQTIYSSKPLTSFRIHPQSQTLVGSKKRGERDFKNQLKKVQRKFLNAKQWQESSNIPTRKYARLSTELNLFLMCLQNRKPINKTRILFIMSSLPFNLIKFFNVTRLHERAFSRVKLFFR